LPYKWITGNSNELGSVPSTAESFIAKWKQWRAATAQFHGPAISCSIVKDTEHFRRTYLFLYSSSLYFSGRGERKKKERKEGRKNERKEEREKEIKEERKRDVGAFHGNLSQVNRASSEPKKRKAPHKLVTPT
jgi:hypothetical protein